MIQVSWENFKDFVRTRQARVNWILDGGQYRVFSFDGPIEIECLVAKAAIPETEQSDFETNFKASANQRQDNTPIESRDNYSARIQASADPLAIAPNSIANIDFEVKQESYINGLTVIVQNPEFGDFLSIQVRDELGVIPIGSRSTLADAWPVVTTYVIKQFVELMVPGLVQANGGTVHRIHPPYVSGKILAGLFLRVSYRAVPTGLNRIVVVNYNFKRKL